MTDYIVQKNGIRLLSAQDFLPELIFDCGQCFRFNPQDDGSWFGVAKGKALSVRTDGPDVVFECSESDFIETWVDYFDLERDYSQIRKLISLDDFTKKAAEYGRGIRILHQDGWEALCSFIISQCNNITRIKGIVERLCTLFGNEFDYFGKTCYTFPSAETIAGLTVSDLAPLRSGYRAEYIINAAKEVSMGHLNLISIKQMSTKDAIKALTSLKGVGTKVANCVLLFGCNKLDAFPVDVWMKRAIEQYYGGKSFDSSVFGENAGIAQQYIFHYIRHL